MNLGKGAEQVQSSVRGAPKVLGIFLFFSCETVP
jgi:hypothetical protein